MNKALRHRLKTNNMKNNLIKTIQKFINTPFKYSDLLAMLDKQQDFLVVLLL